MKLIHVSKTDVGRVRPANEDSIGSIIKNIGIYSNVYIVCDGMGGHVGGARASQIAIRSIDEYFRGTPDPTPNIALKTAIEFANMQIFGDAQANPEYKGMGTTVTLMVESNGLLYIAHVGDSRIYINTDRELYRITKDHSFVQNLVDAGQLTDSEMETHKRKNELTRALGIAMDVDVEVAPQPVMAKKGDKFLLCSDGLCGLINDSMISAAINTYSDLDSCVDELIQLANNAGGHDNISADLIEVLESDFAKTKFVDKNNVPNTNTGTQEVKLPTGRAKPKMDKKLQILLSLVVLIVLAVGANFLINTDNEEVEEDIPEDEEVIDINFEDKLHKLDLSKNYNEELNIIYSSLIGDKNGSNWDFKELTDEIKEREYKIDNSDYQKFYIAKNSAIIDLDAARKSYKLGGKIFEEGDLIYIEVNNLIMIEKPPIVYDQTDNDIVANVISLIGKKRKNLNKTQKQGCTVTFKPKKANNRTAIEQNNQVEVTVKKGNVTTVFTFQETIKADPKLVSKADKKTVKEILKLINSRNTTNIDEKGCTITFNPDKAPPATYEDKTHKFTVIVKLGDAEDRKELNEAIKADQALKDNHDIEAMKKNGWVEKYAWHNEDCLTPDKFLVENSVTPTLYRYLDSEIIKLNIKYKKEINYQKTEYKKYTPKTENCSDQIYLFSSNKQSKNRAEKGTGNKFTEDEITILAECTAEKYPINLCPPNTAE
jgi:serine/threonine protein phosphatase PrpC